MYRKRLIATAVSIFALGVVFGIFVVEHDTFSLRAVFVSCAMFSVLYIIVSKRFTNFARSKSMMAVALAVAAFSFGVLRVSAYNLFGSQTTQFDKKNDDAKFEVSEVNENYIEAYLLSSEIGVPKGELIRLYPENIPDGLVSGDGFSAEVKYSAKNTNNYRANGISLIASGGITEQWDGSGILNSIRRQVSKNSALIYEDFEYAPAISKAVSVGDRSSLDSYIYLLYKSAGISHVMSISGLHISLFAFGLYGILTMLSLRRKFACLFSSLAAIGYTALVGFNVGAVRAACMFVFLMIFRSFKRRSDGITALFISLFLLLIINPYSICSVGLQLSYMCSLGIILSQPMMAKIKMFFQLRKTSSGIVNNVLCKFSLAIITPMILSFVSTVFSFPIICKSFDSVSYISVFVNIVAVPLYSYAIGFALVGFLVAPISLPIAKIISYPAGIIFDFVTDLSKTVHDAGIGNMSAHAPLIIIPVMLSIAMILALVFLSKHQIKVFTIAAVAFCSSLYLCYLMNESLLREKNIIEYSGISGEYVYYQSHESNLYIDISGYTSVPDTVYKNGCVSLERYVVTDYDRYALKRLDNFTGNIKVENVYLPNPENTYERDIYLQIKELANRRNCVIIDYNDVFSQELIDETLIEVFEENAEYTGKLICIDHNGKKIRFVGGNYNHSVYSDVAVILKDYCANAEHIVADQTYAGVEYTDAVSGAERYFSEFEDTLRIETHNQESRLDIYEP